MAVRWDACCAYLFVQQVHEPGLKFVHFGLGVLHFAAMKTRKNYAKQTSPLSHSQTMDASIAALSILPSIDTFTLIVGCKASTLISSKMLIKPFLTEL